MIPDFQDNGYLPPGIHRTSFEELANRFGSQSEIRRVQTESIGWLVDLARNTGVQRLIVNGSYTTDTIEPNDVDCVLLIEENFPKDKEKSAELLAGLPFLELQIVTETSFQLLVNEIFGSDRDGEPKGMVELEL